MQFRPGVCPLLCPFWTGGHFHVFVGQSCPSCPLASFEVFGSKGTWYSPLFCLGMSPRLSLILRLHWHTEPRQCGTGSAQLAKNGSVHASVLELRHAVLSQASSLDQCELARHSAAWHRCVNDSEPEPLQLLDLWGDTNVQAQLEGCQRNKRVYEKISKEMEAVGYKRTAVQCSRSCVLNISMSKIITV